MHVSHIKEQSLLKTIPMRSRMFISTTSIQQRPESSSRRTQVTRKKIIYVENEVN